MTAKRKTSQRRPAIPEVGRESDIAETLKDDSLFQEIVEEILNPREVGKEEKLQSDIGDFLDFLCDPSFASEDAAGFDKRWTEFLILSSALARKQFAKADVTSEKINRLIVPGWACLDEKSGDVRFRFGPPLNGGKAVMVILVFRDAVWHPPMHVEAAVWRHPDLRSAIGKDEYIGWKDRVMQRLNWAASLTDDGSSSHRLRELSDAITSMLYVPTHPDSLEEGWIPTAIESQRFWAVLAHAIDFGIHQNARRFFMDGKLLGSVERSVLNDKVEKLSWFLMIEEAIRENFVATGNVLTPSELRKMFGVKAAPGSDQVILEFADPRFRHHGEITWGPFQKYAKQAGKLRKVRSDDQTQ